MTTHVYCKAGKILSKLFTDVFHQTDKILDWTEGYDVTTLLPLPLLLPDCLLLFSAPCFAAACPTPKPVFQANLFGWAFA